jgi:hypothetical protein
MSLDDPKGRVERLRRSGRRDLAPAAREDGPVLHRVANLEAGKSRRVVVRSDAGVRAKERDRGRGNFPRRTSVDAEIDVELTR